MTKKAIVLTGANGQLGLTLQQQWQKSELAGEFELFCTDVAEMDITSPAQISSVLGELEIAAIVNGAAYTAVDRAESEAELAYSINRDGANNLAVWAKDNGCRLIQISTDFVFSGEKESAYLPSDDPHPLSVYGKSKLEGEQAVLASNPEHSIIIRTSWLYSPFQSNFVKTMLRLMSEREELNIVDDQFGSPTSTYSLAESIQTLIKSSEGNGIYHWCDSGKISWYDFALEIQKLGIEAGILDSLIALNPIPTSEYPTPAQRPKFSVLDTKETQEKFGLETIPWKERLQEVIQVLAV